MSNLLLAVSQDELRAGDHVLAAIMASDHPMVKCVVTDALYALADGAFLDFRRFAAHVHGALLAEQSADTEPAPGHLREMRDAHDASDARG